MVEITSTAQNLAVGDIQVAVAVPEASTRISLGLMAALGIGGLAFGTRRRTVNRI